MVPPLVTVVVPCYNQGHFLEDALRSVRAQHYGPIETIVVNDGSTDRSGEVAQTAASSVIFQSNAGLSAARNAGLTAARGEFLVFLDADDELLPDAVASGVASLQADPKLSCVVRRCQTMDAQRQPLPTHHHEVDTRDLYREWLHYNFVWTPGAAMFRRARLAEIGGFPGDIPPAADYAVYLELARAAGVGYQACDAGRYRQHDGNMSRDPVLMLNATLAALRRERPHVPRGYTIDYRIGLRRWRLFYGEQIVEQLRRDWRTGTVGPWQRQAVWTLMRSAPAVPRDKCPAQAVARRSRDAIRANRAGPFRPRYGTAFVKIPVRLTSDNLLAIGRFSSMPTAIREVDLSSRFAALSCPGNYTRCMLVFRWHRRIVGRAFVAVQAHGVDVSEVARAAATLGPHPTVAWLTYTIGYDARETVGASIPTATVAVCTRERPDDLARTLQGLVGQRHRGHELLVVDNAPLSIRTRQVVERFPGVRYVCEPQIGLNVARNRALREAAGDIVAFTDDDATPEPEWLDELLMNFGDPRVVCATGLTLPIELETEAQELFEEASPFVRGFARRIFDGQHDNPLEVGPVGAGASMALRRNAIDTIGAFDERLDGGMPTRSGGDHEMFVRILAAGHRIVYDPAAVSWHRHRRSREELMETIYGYGVGVYAMWTKLLLEQHEFGVVRLAWSWFRAAHWPEIRRTLRQLPPTRTSPLTRAELRGCLHGPGAWFAARRLRRRAGSR